MDSVLDDLVGEVAEGLIAGRKLKTGVISFLSAIECDHHQRLTSATRCLNHRLYHLNNESRADRACVTSGEQ